MNITSNELAEIITTVIQKQDKATYKPFSFRVPPVSMIGGDVMNEIGEILSEFLVKHVLIVLDKVVYDLGLISPYLSKLEQYNIQYTLFYDVAGEPDTDVVAKGINVLKQSNADFVLAIGGGSALDTGKAIAIMADYCGELFQLKVGGLKTRAIGLGAVPTTAGTGSEVTDITVIKDMTTKIKVPIKGPALVPDLAILDSKLMHGVPTIITASTGIDALTHAIEAYTSIYSNPLSKAYAYHAVENIIEFLPIAVANGEHIEARYQLAISAYKAGIAFSNAGLGLTHAISHQIGNLLNIPHGIANAILLPYVMIFNRLSSETEYSELSTAMKVNRDNMTRRQRCDSAIAKVFQFITDLQLPTELDESQFNESMIKQIATQAMDDICLTGNPRKVTAAQIETFLYDILSKDILKGWRDGS